MFFIKPSFDFFTQQKFRLANQVAHFNKIIYSQFAYFISSRFAQTFIFRNNFLPVVMMFIQQIIEYGTIFKTAVHTLPIKRNNGMCSIPNQCKLITYMPGHTLHRYERAGRVVEEIFFEVMQQRNCIRKNIAEKFLYLCFVVQRFKRR